MTGFDTQATRARRDDPREGEGLSLVVSGKGLYDVHALPARGTATVGRSKRADIRVPDESVSRLHVALHVGPPLELEDLKSSNGTLVNAVAVPSGGRVPIEPGDVIRLGDFALWIERGATVPRRAARVTKDAEAEVVVEAPALRELYFLVERVAVGPINVLLLGETGVGKEVVARAVHARSPRAAKPFVGINCAALAETMLESELFGHEKGAFTGAQEAKPGLLESAEGGTVFLDEVGEMPQGVQAKLLRVLEERAVLRLGSLRPRPIDVRFVTATNRDLEGEVAAGRFRKDLWFRLKGVVLSIPPLRERGPEIEPLARRFARGYAAELGRATPPDISAVALERLHRHTWPGNVRELRNVIERAVLLAGEGPIGLEHLPPEISGGSGRLAVPAAPPAAGAAPSQGAGLHDEIQALERERIARALDECGGNQSRAAKLLGISRGTLLSRLDQFGIARPRKPGKG